ncbi:lipopolysaccharide export LptBFGC system permease protein LptF [Rhodococcus sp. PvR044]|uniref:hypothetical protein n=1 Tax=Rhodococcus sp. PvR044 TaxID=3156402 RepID=UPI003393C668
MFYADTSLQEVAVSHYSGWSTTDWLLAYSTLGAAVLAVAVAVACWVSADYEEEGGLFVAAVVAGIVATVGQAYALWQIARHIESFLWILVLAPVLVAATALAAHRTARAVEARLHGSPYGSSLVSKWLVIVPAGISGVIAVGVFIGDGVTRAAAAVPMAVGAFLTVVAVGVLMVITSGTSERR